MAHERCRALQARTGLPALLSVAPYEQCSREWPSQWLCWLSLLRAGRYCGPACASSPGVSGSASDSTASHSDACLLIAWDFLGQARAAVFTRATERSKVRSASKSGLLGRVCGCISAQTDGPAELGCTAEGAAGVHRARTQSGRERWSARGLACRRHPLRAATWGQPRQPAGGLGGAEQRAFAQPHAAAVARGCAPEHVARLPSLAHAAALRAAIARHGQRGTAGIPCSSCLTRRRRGPAALPGLPGVCRPAAAGLSDVDAGPECSAGRLLRTMLSCIAGTVTHRPSAVQSGPEACA